MRMNRKVTAFMLSCAMLIAGLGDGAAAASVRARSGSVRSEESRETTGKGDSTGTAIKWDTLDGMRVRAASPGGAETGAASAGAVTDAPAGPADSAKPSDEPETTGRPSAVPTDGVTARPSAMPTGEATARPSAIPTGGATSIPSASPTFPATGSVVSGTALSVGQEFTNGTYIYKVLTAGTDTQEPTVKVRTLSAAGATQTSLTIPEYVMEGTTRYEVTGIHKKAFKTNTALKKITIGNNVTYIGERAFQGLKKLTSVRIGGNVKTIKKYAFAGCSTLRMITIPSEVTLIGVKVFNNCSQLKAVVIESSSINRIKKSAFHNVRRGYYIVIPSGKRSLYTSLFKSSGAKTPTVYVY